MTEFVDMLNEMRFGHLSAKSIDRLKTLSRAIVYHDGILPTELCVVFFWNSDALMHKLADFRVAMMLIALTPYGWLSSRLRVIYSRQLTAARRKTLNRRRRC